MDDEFDFSMEDIKALLDSMDTEEKMQSFLYMKPSEFHTILDENMRQRLKQRYQMADRYYLKPLEKLLLFQGKQIGKYLMPYRPEDDLSINEQIVRASIELNRIGFTTEKLRGYVPQTVEDLKALLPDDKPATESRGR